MKKIQKSKRDSLVNFFKPFTFQLLKDSNDNAEAKENSDDVESSSKEPQKKSQKRTSSRKHKISDAKDNEKVSNISIRR